jgi:hypothetical protein
MPVNLGGNAMTLTFDKWKAEVDAALVTRCGLNSNGLPDFAYWDYWLMGKSPSDTAKEVLEVAKGY